MSYIKTKITAVFLCTMLLTSCSGEKDTEELLGQVEQYTKETAEVSGYAYQKELGAWLAPETEYHYEEADDRSDHIVNLLTENSHNLQKDKLYFTINNQANENAERADMLAYVSLRTGEKYYACPDPLCPHTSDSGCLFQNSGTLTFDGSSSDIAYEVRVYDFSSDGIYRTDFKQNMIQLLYPVDPVDPDAYYTSCNIQFISGDQLYFLENVSYHSKDEEENTITTYKKSMKSLNLTDGTVETLNDQITEYFDCKYSNGEKLFFVNYDTKQFYMTDMDFADKQTILALEETQQFGSMFYDTLENAFYLGISDDAGERTGKILRINQDYQCEEIPLPSDRILSFQLTDNYIYYTVYDPVVYGTSPRSGATVDENGSKIYRTPRSNPTEGELVFDGKGELFFRNYVITGNYFYLEYYSLIEEGGFTWFRRMGSTMRVNFAEGTLKWLNLD